MAEARAHMDDALTCSSGFPAPADAAPQEPDPLPVRRFARGTSERSAAEVRAMIAGSIAAVPAPQIICIPARISRGR